MSRASTGPVLRAAEVLLVCVMASAGGPASAAEAPADLVLHGGRVYTLQPASPWAEALAVRGGEIVAVGDEADLEGLLGPDTERVELDGRMVLPGFHDAHAHPLSGGYTLLGCSLLDAASVEAIGARLRECHAARPEGWLRATGFDLALFPGGAPRRETLDAWFPERPVYLDASDGHSGWLNTRALEQAGIDAGTPDPHGGEIVRDPETGEPTGTLRDTAMDLVDPFLPARNLETDIEALQAAQAHLVMRGVTSVIDIAYNPRNWEAWRAMDRAGTLRLRVRSALVHGAYAEYPADRFEALLGKRGDYATSRLDTNSVKLFLDGGLEGQSAALLEPYTVEPPHRGKLNFEPEVLAALVTRLDAMGLQLHLHAIGDRAVRAGLDAVAAAIAANGRGDGRHQITHLQLIDPEDYGRFAALGVAANFQALWAYPDRWIMELNLPVVGMERVQRMYPIASVARAGGRIVGSSDWDVSSANPLEAIETAVRRQDAALDDGPVLNAGERVDLATMLAAYTREAAWVMHQDGRTGVLAPGYRADLVVLDRDLFAVPAHRISEACVDLTVIDGEVVYRARRDQSDDCER